MGRRVTIDLTDAAEAEVDRLKKEHACTTAHLFRCALTLLRIYSDATSKGNQVCVRDPSDPNEIVRVQMPI